MKVQIQGIFPVLPTPFNSGGRIDSVAMARVVRFCIDSGAHGIVYPGVASEVEFLTSGERHALFEIVCSEVGGKLPVICGASADTPEAVALHARSAKELGAAASMVMMPQRFANDLQGALRFMRSVEEMAPDTDFVLQNAPPPVGAGLDPDLIIQIVSSCESVRYVKEESLPTGPRITAISTSPPRHFRGVVGGAGARYLIDEMNRGALAAMPATEIVDLHVKMWNAYGAGEVRAARALYSRTLPLLLIQAIYRMRLTKAVLQLRGVLHNSIVRAPLPEFDSIDRAEISEQLAGVAELFSLATMQEAA